MRKGLYANIHAKRKRGGKMRKKGAKGAPTAAQFKRAAMTVKKKIMVAKKYQNPSGGLNEAGRKYFKRTTGANLKRPSKKGW